MNVEALFLFLILLLGLVLCSFLGGNCNYSEGFSKNNNSDVNNDSSSNLLNSKIKQNNNSSNLNNFNDRDNSNNSSNSNNFNNRDNSNNSSNSNSNYDNYNHYSGSSSSSQLTNGSTFTSPDGGTITVNVSSDGTQSLQVTPPNGGKPSTFTIKESMTSYSGKNGSAVKFYGPNGQTAVVIKTNDGQQAIKITDILVALDQIFHLLVIIPLIILQQLHITHQEPQALTMLLDLHIIHQELQVLIILLDLRIIHPELRVLTIHLDLHIIHPEPQVLTMLQDLHIIHPELRVLTILLDLHMIILILYPAEYQKVKLFQDKKIYIF